MYPGVFNEIGLSLVLARPLSCGHFMLFVFATVSLAYRLNGLMSERKTYKKRLVIVGNGMAAGRIIDELIARDTVKPKSGHSLFDITIIGDETCGSYNRIMLSSVLAGTTSAMSIIQKPASWYAQQGMRFMAGIRVTQINRQQCHVLCANDERIPYDHLIIATGSRPAHLPALNQNIAGVMAFRTLADVDTILSLSQTAKHAVVIGGGLLGLEAAYGMAVRGLQVVLVHRSAWLLNRQLDEAAAAMLARVMTHKGVVLKLAAQVARFNGQIRVESAQLTSGEILPCDVAVIATGITPNAELGIEAGLQGQYGIAVNDFLVTSDPHISAIGECAEHKGKTFGLVEPIWQHCISVADRLVRGMQTAYQNTPVATKLKVSGVQVFSAGEWLTSPEHRAFIFVDSARNIYRKLLLKNNCIVGIVFFGDVRDGQYFFELMERQISVIQAMPQLLMGRRFCTQLPSMMALPMNKTI